MIELARQSVADAPAIDEVIGGVRHTLQLRRRRQTMLASAVCVLLIAVPLTFSLGTDSAEPTLVEAVSATVRQAPNDMPAPIQGYRNSIRNHQTLTII